MKISNINYGQAVQVFYAQGLTCEIKKLGIAKWVVESLIDEVKEEDSRATLHYFTRYGLYPPAHNKKEIKLTDIKHISGLDFEIDTPRTTKENRVVEMTITI